MIFLTLSVCFGMLTAGFEKALNWIDFNSNQGGFVAWWQTTYYTNERTDFLGSAVPKLDPLVLESFDYLAVLFELSPFFLLILGAQFWRLWICIAGFFHLGNLLFLNIPFTILMPVYGIFILPRFTHKLEIFFRNFMIQAYGKNVFLVTTIFVTIVIAAIKVPSSLYIDLVLWIVFIFVSITSFLNVCVKHKRV